MYIDEKKHVTSRLVSSSPSAFPWLKSTVIGELRPGTHHRRSKQHQTPRSNEAIERGGVGVKKSLLQRRRQPLKSCAAVMCSGYCCSAGASSA